MMHMATSNSSKSSTTSSKLVHGFVREIELSPLYCLFSIIPTDIQCMIEIYQKYACDDKWDDQHSSTDITITQSPDNIISKYIIKMNKNHDSTAFGRNIISLGKGSQGIAEWRLQMISLTCSWNEPPFIGIIEDSTDNLQMYKDNSNWWDKGYQLSIGNGEIISSFTKDHQVSANTNIIKNKLVQDVDLKQYDFVDLILNLFESKMTFIFKGDGMEDLVINIQNIKRTRYRLAVSGLFCKSSEFALMK